MRREQVVYSDQVIQKCSATISKAVGASVYLNKKQRGQQDRVFFCVPCGDNVIKYADVEDDARKTWCLVEVDRDDVCPCAIGIRLKFEHERTVDVLTSASILIAIQDGGPQPVYRAEWDYNDYMNEKSSHAQPHWHALVPRKKSEESRWEAEIVDFELIETDPIDTSNVHLAMSANWHDKDSRYRHNIDNDDSLNNWISGVITYALQQLVHLRKRLGDRVVREFGSLI